MFYFDASKSAPQNVLDPEIEQIIYDFEESILGDPEYAKYCNRKQDKLSLEPTIENCVSRGDIAGGFGPRSFTNLIRGSRTLNARLSEFPLNLAFGQGCCDCNVSTLDASSKKCFWR